MITKYIVYKQTIRGVSSPPRSLEGGAPHRALPWPVGARASVHFPNRQTRATTSPRRHLRRRGGLALRPRRATTKLQTSRSAWHVPRGAGLAATPFPPAQVFAARRARRRAPAVRPRRSSPPLCRHPPRDVTLVAYTFMIFFHCAATRSTPRSKALRRLGPWGRTAQMLMRSPSPVRGGGRAAGARAARRGARRSAAPPSYGCGGCAERARSPAARPGGARARRRPHRSHCVRPDCAAAASLARNRPQRALSTVSRPGPCPTHVCHQRYSTPLSKL